MADYPGSGIPPAGWKETSPIDIGDTWETEIRMASGTLVVRMRIIDQRQVYGRNEYQIAPVSGRGTAWVREDSLRGNLATVPPRKTKARRQQREQQRDQAREREDHDVVYPPTVPVPAESNDQPTEGSTPGWAASRQPRKE